MFIAFQATNAQVIIASILPVNDHEENLGCSSGMTIQPREHGDYIQIFVMGSIIY